MRKNLLTLVLISSFVFGSLPFSFAHAEENAPVDTSAAIEATTTPATPIEAAPSEDATTTEPVFTEPLQTTPILSENPLTQESSSTATSATTTLAFSVDLPNGCDVRDSTGALHVFPEATTSPEYVAVCGLAQAVADGQLSGFVVQDSSFGLYVTSVNGIAAGPDEYWALWNNDAYASCGVSCLELKAGDTLALKRTKFTGEESDSVTITVSALKHAYANIDLPDGCTITDSAGVAHIFPDASSTPSYLAACALAAAKDAGKISGYIAQDSSFGLYVTSVNSIAAGPSEYWALWLNGGYASCGIDCLTLSKGDVLSFVRTTFDGAESDRIDLHVVALTHKAAVPSPSSGGTGNSGSGSGSTLTFRIPDAFSFLVSHQGTDGSFDGDLYTDWSAVAFANSGAPSDAKEKLAQYLRDRNPHLDSALDYERHAMALMALGINPYTGGRADYITPIVNSFDGTQIDDPGLVNDDIFAIFPLMRGGYSANDPVIAKTAGFIVSKQQSDGSWEESRSVTAAAVQALSLTRSITGASDALVRAEAYLRGIQDADGGFSDTKGTSDPFATSWVLQAIKALGESPADWSAGGKTPLDYLASVQATDGGVTTVPNDDSTREWGTAYAITAAKNVTWNSLLHSFSKPKQTALGNTEKHVASPATTTPSVLPVGPSPIATSTASSVSEATTTLVYVPLGDTTVTQPTPVRASRTNVVALDLSKLAPAPSVTGASTTKNSAFTASAGSADTSVIARFFGSLWHAILSFFAKIF